MRMLLVASQGGGVGTTTAAVNLAAAASATARVLLLDADPTRSAIQALGLGGEPVADPIVGRGGVWYDTPGGFDVATPYDGDPNDLAVALVALKQHGPDSYDFVVIDAPPGSGRATCELLRVADELVLVERADKTRFRALPAFLEAIREARRDGATVGVRGILLTLPTGVAPGGPVELELRQKFKGILPQTIPFDPAVTTASRPVVSAMPHAPAGRQYVALAQALKLTAVRQRELVPAAPARPSQDDVGIFDAPRSGSAELPLSGRTETFYHDRRPRVGKGPDLTMSLPRGVAPPPPRTRFSMLEIGILAGSAAFAAIAAVWFCLG